MIVDLGTNESMVDSVLDLVALIDQKKTYSIDQRGMGYVVGGFVEVGGSRARRNYHSTGHQRGRQGT